MRCQGQRSALYQDCSLITVTQQPATLESQKQCRRFKGRHCFIFFVTAPLLMTALLSGLFVWQQKSPRLSFTVIKIALATRLSFVATSLIDQETLWTTLTDELAPILLNNPPRDEESKLSPVEQNQRLIMKNTISKVLPPVITSMMSIQSSEKSATNPADNIDSVLPMILRVSPEIWTQWLVEIKRGEFSLGECQTIQTRSACELIIHGPLKQTVTIALLWEKRSLFWHLRGIAGLDRLLVAMRNTPKIP